MVTNGFLIQNGNQRHAYYMVNVHRAKNVHRNEVEKPPENAQNSPANVRKKCA